MEKFASQIDSAVKNKLDSYVKESGRKKQDVVNEALKQYLDRVAVRPVFLEAADRVLSNPNVRELVRRLSK
ncbi:MAG: hypothetical protein WCI18_01125 [Pseudomonadota bacterium]